MKNLYIIILLAFLFACNNKEENQASIPTIDNITLVSNIVNIPDTLYFDAIVSDYITPLSTLEVSIVVNNNKVVEKSIRTKGNQVQLVKESIALPFLANIPEGKAKVVFTLINIDGFEQIKEIDIDIKRPILPSKLYITGNSEFVLFQDKENPMLYRSDEGEYNSIFTGTLSTDTDLEKADFIWKAGKENNTAVVDNRFATDITISFPTWLVSQVIFDALSFTFSVAGTEVDITINNNQMQGIGNFFYSKAVFEKDGIINIEGLTKEQIAKAYNRDFFNFDKETGKLKFTGESGTWEVYYSLKYNYFWVNRMEDVAPKAFWIIGSGFTSAPEWNSDFNDLGWDLDDILQIAYMKNLGNNKYQATIYINEEFDIKVFINRTWGAEDSPVIFSKDLLTGDKIGIIPAGGNLSDLINGDGFVPGYYRITADLSNISEAKVNFELLK